MTQNQLMFFVGNGSATAAFYFAAATMASATSYSRYGNSSDGGDSFGGGFSDSFGGSGSGDGSGDGSGSGAAVAVVVAEASSLGSGTLSGDGLFRSLVAVHAVLAVVGFCCW